MVKRAMEEDVRTSKRRRFQQGQNSQPSQPSDADVILNRDEYDDEELDEIQPAPIQGSTTSARPRMNRKRTTTSTTYVRDKIEDDEIIPVYNNTSNRNGTGHTPSTQAHLDSQQDITQEEEYEEDDIEPVNPDMRGESDSDDDHRGRDEEDSAPLQPSSSGHSTCGILSSVRLDNIMCHRCFEFDLGPNVNIVNGKNGSGKSAIVAAVQLGLGGNPRITERASKAEEHITNGENSGAVTINILNKRTSDTADMTYKHSTYGDMITIERKLFRGKNGRGGGSSWAVRGRKGHNIKLPEGVTARREMLNIVDHFGFMVDNPVAVLTQNRSKEFLAKGKGTHQYKLYREATLLEPLSREIIDTYRAIKSMADLVKKSEEKQPTTTRKLDKLEAAHRDAQEMKTIHLRIKEETIRLVWTEHHEQLHNLNARERQFRETIEPAEASAKQALDRANAKLIEMNTNIESKKTKLEESMETVKIMANDRRKSQVELNKSKAEYEDLKNRIRDTDQEVKDMDRNAEREQIRMDQARTAHFKGQEQKTRWLEEMKGMREEEKVLLDQIAADRQEVASLDSERMDLREEFNRLQERSRHIEQERETKIREYDQVKRDDQSRNQLQRFGQNIPTICDIIERNLNRFRHKPVGPLGKYVKVMDESWSKAIESAISRGVLCTFLVNNTDDQNTLFQLLPRNMRRPHLQLSDLRAPRYNGIRERSPNLGESGYTTLFDQITVNNDHVFNALADNFLHQVVLNDQDDITRLAWSHTPNVKSVYNKQGEHATERGGSKTFRGASRYGGDLLTSDPSRYLDTLQRQVNDLIEQCGRSTEALRECQKKQQEISRRSNDIQYRIRDAESKQMNIEQRRQKIEDQLARADDAFDPSPYERRIEEAHQKKQEAERQCSQCEAQIEQARQKVQQCLEAVEDCKKRASEAQAVNRELTQAVEEHMEEIGASKSKARSYKRNWEEAKYKLDQASGELEARRAKVDGIADQARRVGECPDDIDIKENPSSKVARSINMLEGRMRTERKRRGGKSAEEIEKEWLQAKKQHQKNFGRLRRVKGYLKALNLGVKTREYNLKRLERLLKDIVRDSFRTFLKTRGHEGSIQFRTEGQTKELVITVQMSSHDRGDGEKHKTVDLRSLSGGERSFVTLCFMMALAEICQNPLRIMDEIDVYQDETNRRASFKIITDFFQSFLVERQVVIITPHSLPNIQVSPGCRIVKLPDPRENTDPGQTRLDDFYGSNIS